MQHYHPIVKIKDKYELLKKIHSDRVSEIWLSRQTTNHANYFLIKTWHYNAENQETLSTLWKNEMRILYRLSSSANASEYITPMVDGSIDEENQYYYIVSRANGFDQLHLQLNNSFKSKADPTTKWHHRNLLTHYLTRKKIWQGLKNVVQAIQLLHQQSMIHRNISAEAIYFDKNIGAESFKLSHFEWTIRLGNSKHNGLQKEDINHWTLPPESMNEQGEFNHQYRFDYDWYAFGILIARCFFDVEAWSNRNPKELNKLIYDKISMDHVLSAFERNFILRLIDPDITQRLNREHDILANLNYIISSLQVSLPKDKKQKPLLLLISRYLNHSIRQSLEFYGFMPNPKDKSEAYNPENFNHIVELKNFLDDNFKKAKLYINEKNYLLIGKKVIFSITSYKDRHGQASWDVAFVKKTAVLPTNLGSEYIIDLSHVPIQVITHQELGKTYNYDGIMHQSWDIFLPQKNVMALKKHQLSYETEMFRQFLQCTNQLEILIRDSEIFECQVVSHQHHPEFGELITIQEVSRTRPVTKFCQIEGGLVEFLQRELESNKIDCDKVLITDTDSLRISIERQTVWEIKDINKVENYVILKRKDQDSLALQDTDFIQKTDDEEQDSTPTRVNINYQFQRTQRVYVRTWGHYGQIKLIERRKKAIDNLKQYPYLLQALAEPKTVLMDTQEVKLPYPLPEDKVDQSKIAVIKDILRGSPIYALQGPPGTGKTTLVAHLLREILEDDPMAQILVTAQAHGAVDVLKDKVRSEVFGNVADLNLPLSIRLSTEQSDRSNPGGDIKDVTRQLLALIQQQLINQDNLPDLQKKWLELVNKLLHKSYRDHQIAFDLEDLIKRGSNITYCTTSHKELEFLAETSQSFDWSIVEEAGKAHGFDLALPLQTGHRWILLGDHKQLPPYRYQHYSEGVNQLDNVIKALNELPGRSDTKLIDHHWIYAWRQRDDESKELFKVYAQRWIKTFSEIFRKLSIENKNLTQIESIGAAAGILSLQYRMHHGISDIISQVFYQGVVKNGPVSYVHRIVEPEFLRNKAVVWVDTPWCQFDHTYEEHGPRMKKSRYTNPREVDVIKDLIRHLKLNTQGQTKPVELAVLSPYTRQVALLNSDLRRLQLPDGLTYRKNLNVKNGDIPQQREYVRPAHTVDSFQGNEADVVIVSLVRNNIMPPQNGLGFLSQADRLNVLLSRTKTLLILVGSWEFFYNQVADLKLGDELDSHHPLYWMRHLVEVLEHSFEKDYAIRIPYDSLSKDEFASEISRGIIQLEENDLYEF